MRCRSDQQKRQQRPRRRNQRGAHQRRSSCERRVLYIERAAPEPEDRGDGDIARRFLEVETLEQVEDAERYQQRHRESKRPQATPVQVIGADKEHRGDRDRQCVEDAQLLDGFDLQEEMAAPGDVRCQRRDKVDGRDRCCRKRNDQRQRVGATEGAKRKRKPVKAEPPGSSVAPARGQVTPVLDDQPDRDDDRQCGREAVVDESEQRTGEQREQDEQTEMPVVPAQAKKEHARTEPVPLDPKHHAAQAQPDGPDARRDLFSATACPA